MKYNENKMTTRELQAEVARYEVEKRERDEESKIEEQKQICWEQYEAMKKTAEDKAVFEMAIYMLTDDQIPVKDEDVEAEIEECFAETSDEEELEKDPFVAA